MPSAAATARQQESRASRAWLVFFAGWLVPGAGYAVEKRFIRATLVFASVMAMFICGLAMQGKIYAPNTGDVLDILGFVGDIGAAGLYLLAKIAGWGSAPVQVVVADYGTKFIVVAGLLNFISAVDAHNISLGKKR